MSPLRLTELVQTAAVVGAAALLAACDDPTTDPRPSSVCDVPELTGPPITATRPFFPQAHATPLAGGPYAVAISPQGSVFVTAPLSSRVARANLPSTTFFEQFNAGDSPAQVRISPDGQTAYVSNQDEHRVLFVNTATNQPFDTVVTAGAAPGGRILNLALSPDGLWLYALTRDVGIWVINTATRTVTTGFPVQEVGTILIGVAIHPASPCMYVAAFDEGAIRTVDLTTNTVVRTDSIPGSRIQSLAVAHDGTALYATDTRRSMLLVRDLRDRNAPFVAQRIGTAGPDNLFDVAITPDNTQIYVSAMVDGGIFVLDRLTRVVVGGIVTAGEPRYMAFTPSGSHAVVSNNHGWVDFIFDDSTAVPPCYVARRVVPAPSSHPALTARDSTSLAGFPSGSAVSGDGTVFVTQLGGAVGRGNLPGTALTPIALGLQPDKVRFSPDGRTAYVSERGGGPIHVVDVATNQRLSTLTIPSGQTTNIVLTADGKRLYVLSDDSGIFLIDVERNIATKFFHPAIVGDILRAVAVHPTDPCLYVAARNQHKVRTIDMRTNTIVREDSIPGAHIENLAIAPDGATLFATDIQRSRLLALDLTVKTTSVRQYQVGQVISDNAFDVAVTPDNAFVYVTTMVDGFVYVFSRSTGADAGAVNVGGVPRSISFSHDGTYAVVPNLRGWVNFLH